MAIDNANRKKHGGANPFNNPWPVLATGLGLIVIAFIWVSAFKGSLLAVGGALAALGVLAAGIAVAIRPASSVVLFLGALGALLAGQVFGNEEMGWDSAQILLRVITVIGLSAALLMLLPRTARRVAVSLLVVVHFGGILTAVTSASPAYIPQQLWTFFYRPYLQFFYLNNAYHFYSPDPGPAPLLWFYVQYEPDPDGTQRSRWVLVPDYDKDGHPIRPDGSPLRPYVQYTRRLSLCESANFPGPTPANFDNLYKLRMLQQTIPIPSDVPLLLQYREPDAVAKRWISVYARHVARSYKCQVDPDRKVTGVKVYRVIHQIITPGQVAMGVDWEEPILYHPYYVGEFYEDGRMKEDCLIEEIADDGSVVTVNRDPMLYWLIPIMKVPKDPKQVADFEHWRQHPEDYIAKNYVYVHAGDKTEGKQLP